MNRLQRAIIQGVLDGFTYQEIKNNYAIARNYETCYLARYVAYHLWKLLTEVLKDAGIIDPDERVRNKNLWESVMRVAQQSLQSESVQKSQPPVSLNCIFRSHIKNPLPLSPSPLLPLSPYRETGGSKTSVSFSMIASSKIFSKTGEGIGTSSTTGCFSKVKREGDEPDNLFNNFGVGSCSK